MAISLPPLDQIVASVPRDQIPAAIMGLTARLLAEPAPVANGTAPVADDPMLTVDQAAKFLHRERRWFYRHKHLPFIVRVGRSLLISKRGLDKWLAGQRVK